MGKLDPNFSEDWAPSKKMAIPDYLHNKASYL